MKVTVKMRAVKMKAVKMRTVKIYYKDVVVTQFELHFVLENQIKA